MISIELITIMTAIALVVAFVIALVIAIRRGPKHDYDHFVIVPSISTYSNPPRIIFQVFRRWPNTQYMHGFSTLVEAQEWCAKADAAIDSA